VEDGMSHHKQTREEIYDAVLAQLEDADVDLNDEDYDRLYLEIIAEAVFRLQSARWPMPKCEECNGTGKDGLRDAPCPVCEGSGRSQAPRQS
jgi:hypothetical protein